MSPSVAGPGPVSGLLRATVVAARRLESVRGAPDPERRVECRQLDRMLREAVERHPVRRDDQLPGLSALRVGCAHLAAGDVEDAYFALLTARDLLR